MARRGLQILIFLLAAGQAAAHPALYHYLEINLLEPGEVPIFVTFHAPELSDEVAPLEADVFGREWLSTRDDETIAGLVENAHRFADEVFSYQIGKRVVRPELVFPDSTTIRDPGPESAVPEGCFSGGSTLPYQVGEETLLIEFSGKAQKRLMLIINRPGDFPQVIDLEPGGRHEVALPPVPVSAWQGGRSTARVAGVLLPLIVLTMALIRRRRACLR